MLDRAKTLKSYKLNGRDGEIGSVKDLYFDDQHWAIRYLVADTGGWLSGRKVLISPYALNAVNGAEHHIAIDLTKKQLEDSPSLDTDKPVSRQYEEAYYTYFGWPLYWSGPYLWGAYPHIARNREQWKNAAPAGTAWDPHLRSTNDVSGHHIQTIDGEIGHVEDFIIDDETWEIRYLIVDTGSWWPGKKVLVSPRWIDRISWSDATVFVRLTRETIKQAPAYTEGVPLTRDYEARLHQHYSLPGYWADDLAATHHAH